MQNFKIAAHTMMQHECSRGKAPKSINSELEVLLAHDLKVLPQELEGTQLLTRDAGFALSRLAMSRIHLLQNPVRANAISFSPRALLQQEQAHPRYRFWNILAEASQSASSFPFSEQDIVAAAERLED
jgi:hypothetical protein